jgi:hypothetical protein
MPPETAEYRPRAEVEARERAALDERADGLKGARAAYGDARRTGASRKSAGNRRFRASTFGWSFNAT